MQDQFPLTDVESCKIYLRKVINVADKARYQLRRYLGEGKSQLSGFQDVGAKAVSYDVYEDTYSLFYSAEACIIHIFVDTQEHCVSYLNFRKRVDELEGIGLPALSKKEEEILRSFSEAMESGNHTPESFIIAEQELARAGKGLPVIEDPLEVYIPKYIRLDFYEEMIKHYQKIYDDLTKLISAAMRDYSALYGKKVELKRYFFPGVVKF